jgi:hypothetical protein
VIRPVLRPAFPGELNHELVWPLGFLAAGGLGWAWFRTGWRLPDCLFLKWTGYPCLGCGGTRCARHLAAGDLAGAWPYHPLFWTAIVLLAAWTLWSAVWWLRGDPRRLRLAFDETGARWLRVGLGVALLANWLWQCHYLRA